uniref:Major vault protein n=1 Tax=Plectus sambesii TaxID=2011161 RepID=A0A914WZP9_9BILA
MAQQSTGGKSSTYGSGRGPTSDGDAIFRLPPFFYMHVLDLNANVTRVEIGPKTYVRQDNERVVLSPERMITVPPRHYCVIENPVARDEDGVIKLDASGQVHLAHADQEIRLPQDPFPLYPGEVLKTPPTKLQVVPADSALRLKAILDFEDVGGKKRVAGDEWLFEGPGTYIPRKEVTVEEVVHATTIRPNEALKLRARRETVDRDGRVRVTGEEWLVHKVGAYLPGAYEDVVETVHAHVLTEKKALHVRATRTFKDQFNIVRKNGEEWLVQMKDSDTYIPEIYEEVVEEIFITTLSNRQYAVIVNPVGADGKPQLCKRKLIQGEKSFFLQPGEHLERGIQNVYVLSENEGLILRANEAYTDTVAGVERLPGDKWMIRGPTEYVPPVEVEVVTQRTAIPLDENEGIYVRDIKTGRVRAIIGESYMLTQDEEQWAKELPKDVESLLGYHLGPVVMPQRYPPKAASGRNIPPAPLPAGASFGAMQSVAIQQQMPNQNQQVLSQNQGPFKPPPGSSFNALQAFSQEHFAPSTQRGVSFAASPGNIASFGLANAMPNQMMDEELWPKDLPEAAEALIGAGKDPLADRGERGGKTVDGRGVRDKTKVVTFRVPHNAAVQIYDYKEKKARVVFGPDLVMLGPDEHFTQLSLSGGKPKRPNVIRSLCLLLGPDFCTDIVTVETSDHARLQLQLSYNWHFDIGDKSAVAATKLFSVPDFIGDACKAIASRVRGMVAQVPFDEFHKNSARIIRTAVFGMDDNGKVGKTFHFPQNNLVITSTDIQSVEPVDQRTRDSLQKSVQLAIEITTNSQEATARHEAERLEQEARGRLERQKISDEAEAERARKDLLELQAQSAAVESTGQAKAEAYSQAESARIEGEAAVEQARLKAEASKIETESELERLTAAREAELKYLSEKNHLDIEHAQSLSAIELTKFKDMVGALGADTIRAIAVAGPEMQ